MHTECPLCRNKTFQLKKISAKNRSYNLCSSCELIQMGKEFLINEKAEKERYLLHDNSITNEGYSNYLKEIIKKYISPYLKTEDCILDFGSGQEAVLSEILKKQGYKNISAYDKYFAEDNSVLNKKYNGIIAIEVIEHITDIRKILSLLCSMLFFNGYLIIHSLFHNNIDFKKWWYAEDITHVTFLSEITIKKISEVFKLEILNLSESACVFKKIKKSKIRLK